MSTTWTGITLLPGALGAQVLDLLGPWHNCTGLIKSILRCKLSADDFRRAGLRRVTDSLFGGRGDTGPPVLGDPTSGREPNGLDLRTVLHQEALGYLTSIIVGVFRILASAVGENIWRLHKYDTLLSSNPKIGYLTSIIVGVLEILSSILREGDCIGGLINMIHSSSAPSPAC